VVLTNPDFEFGAVYPSTWTYACPAGWVCSGTGVIYKTLGGALWGAVIPAYSGVYYGGIRYLNTYMEQTVTQPYYALPTFYYLQLWASNRNTNTATFTVIANGVPVLSGTPAVAPVWTSYNTMFNISA